MEYYARNIVSFVIMLRCVVFEELGVLRRGTGTLGFLCYPAKLRCGIPETPRYYFEHCKIPKTMCLILHAFQSQRLFSVPPSLAPFQKCICAQHATMATLELLMPNAWPHDDTKSKTTFFGPPGSNLVAITPPFQMFYDKHPIKTITVNKKIATAMLTILTEISDGCGHDQKRIDATGISNWGGCYNPRNIRGSSTSISNHAFAAAVDIDPERNPLGAKVGKMPKLVIDAFKRQGALWGGDYKGRKDWMHFEFVSR